MIDAEGVARRRAVRIAVALDALGFGVRRLAAEPVSAAALGVRHALNAGSMISVTVLAAAAIAVISAHNAGVRAGQTVWPILAVDAIRFSGALDALPVNVADVPRRAPMRLVAGHAFVPCAAVLAFTAVPIADTADALPVQAMRRARNVRAVVIAAALHTELSGPALGNDTGAVRRSGVVRRTVLISFCRRRPAALDANASRTHLEVGLGWVARIDRALSGGRALDTKTICPL